jgi:hypothetical protein
MEFKARMHITPEEFRSRFQCASAWLRLATCF